MRPVLALELSVDGILLHELSYDGKWRKIASAALSDPFLPKKMKAMKATAKASQGQWFKNEVWVPRDQMYSFEMQSDAEDDADRQAEAHVALSKNPAIPAGEYVIRLSDEDAKGNIKGVAIEQAVLDQTRRFVGGYGFNCDGITVPGKVPGFHTQPYFDSLSKKPPVVSVDYRKFGFFAGLSAAAVGVVAGGYWLYSSIEFIPDPATVLEASENRIFSDEEDPRAPIRPTVVSSVVSQVSSVVLAVNSENTSLPGFDDPLDTFTTHVASTDMTSSLDVEVPPEHGAPLATIAFWQEAPVRATEGRPDSLPAPESNGFAVFATALQDPSLVTTDSNIALGTPITTFIGKSPEIEFDLAALAPDALPSDESTVVLAAQARKLNDSFGLTQVRESNAAAVRLERASDLQNVAAIVIEGQPEILPSLRSGFDVTDIREPVVVIAVVEQPQISLQNLAAVVIEGPPPIVPILRPELEVVAEPVVEEQSVAGIEQPELTLEELQNLAAVVIDGAPNVVPELRPSAEVDVEPVIEDPVVEEPVIVAEQQPELSLDELQNLAAVVIEGPPSVIPTLRVEVEVAAEPVVEEPVIIAEPQPELSLDELQNLTAVVVEGPPNVVPTLRAGVEIGAEPVDVVEVPETVEPTDEVIVAEVAPELSLDELQNLAAVVIEGSPSRIPELRPAAEIDAEPTAPVAPDDETVEPIEPIDPATLETQIAALQAAPANVLEGRPPLIPPLRDDADLDAGTGVVVEEVTSEEQIEAARLRPILRPETIVEIAVVNDPDLSEVAVTQAASPFHRSAEFASRVETMTQSFAETERTTPRFTEEPREVSLPTSANVAAEATIENGINLNATSLIGVYGKPGTYRALVRQSGGIYSMVQIGQEVGGWQVVGIDESTVRIQRGSRSEVLRLPAPG